MTKNIGDSGSPGLSPQPCRMGLLGMPFRRTLEEDVERSAATQLWKREGEPMLLEDGMVAAGVYYSNSKQYNAPSSTVTAGKPGTPVARSSTSLSSSGSGSSSSSRSTVALTGVFTATATPSPTQGAATERVTIAKWIQNLLALVAVMVVM